MRKELGLDQIFIERYTTWITNSLHGDFGNSYITNKPVIEEMKLAIPATLHLAFVALFIIIFVSVLAAVLCTVYEGSMVDLNNKRDCLRR